MQIGSKFQKSPQPPFAKGGPGGISGAICLFASGGPGLGTLNFFTLSNCSTAALQHLSSTLFMHAPGITGPVASRTIAHGFGDSFDLIKTRQAPSPVFGNGQEHKNCDSIYNKKCFHENLLTLITPSLTFPFEGAGGLRKLIRRNRFPTSGQPRTCWSATTSRSAANKGLPVQ